MKTCKESLLEREMLVEVLGAGGRGIQALSDLGYSRSEIIAALKEVVDEMERMADDAHRLFPEAEPCTLRKLMEVECHIIRGKLPPGGNA